jgi:hypothetical protein
MSDVLTEESENYLWKKRHAVLYHAELSSLYHRKRERFFALFDRGSKAFALIAGTAAFSSLLETAEAKSYAGLVVALVTIPGLVFGWADKARLHSDLAQKFTQIQAEIAQAGERDFTEQQLNEWSAKLRLIEATEPPALSALVKHCQNQLAAASGEKDKITSLSWSERWLGQIFDISPKS